MTEHAELINKAIQEMEKQENENQCYALAGDFYKGKPCCKASYKDGTYEIQQLNWLGKLVVVKKRNKK